MFFFFLADCFFHYIILSDLRKRLIIFVFLPYAYHMRMSKPKRNLRNCTSISDFGGNLQDPRLNSVELQKKKKKKKMKVDENW